jgi:hypothetical protein
MVAMSADGMLRELRQIIAESHEMNGDYLERIVILLVCRPLCSIAQKAIESDDQI